MTSKKERIKSKFGVDKLINIDIIQSMEMPRNDNLFDAKMEVFINSGYNCNLFTILYTYCVKALKKENFKGLEMRDLIQLHGLQREKISVLIKTLVELKLVSKVMKDGKLILIPAKIEYYNKLIEKYPKILEKKQKYLDKYRRSK